MIRIGLTGGLASGKSTSLKILQELGCKTISSDDITRELMKSNKRLIEQLKLTFNCVDDNGVVDRKALGRLIFNDKKAKEKLESLTHPLVKIVRKEFFKKCEETGSQFVVCETPLLFEKDLIAEFDYSIVIVAGLDIRIDRYIESGKGDQDKFFTITKNQLLDNQKTSQADFVIKNNGTKEQLKEKLENTLKEVLIKHQKKMTY